MTHPRVPAFAARRTFLDDRGDSFNPRSTCGIPAIPRRSPPDSFALHPVQQRGVGWPVSLRMPRRKGDERRKGAGLTELSGAKGKAPSMFSDDRETHDGLLRHAHR